MYESRREYLTHHRSARAWAALDRATNDRMKVTYDPYVTKRDSLNGKHVVVIGSGVGGLTTAYELLANNSDVKVTILEARNRTGGGAEFLLWLPLRQEPSPSLFPSEAARI